MVIFLEEIVMQLLLWFLRLIDGVLEIFDCVTGTADVTMDGETVNIVDTVLTNSTVQNVFWAIVILGVGLACIFTIVAVIRNMVDGKKTLSSIVGKFFLSLLGTLAVFCAVILGVLVAEELLKLLADIFNLETNVKLSTSIFDACVGEWKNGYSSSDFDVATVKVSDLLGSYKTSWGVWPKSWKGDGMIDPDSFYYVSAIVGVAVIAYFLIMAVIAMARRIFEIVYVYLCMPAAMSPLPLDDGSRMRNWTESFISKFLLAFGTVISLNVFIILLPIINSLTIPGAGSFENSIFTVVLLIGGGMVIPSGQNLFVRIFGTPEDYRPSGIFGAINRGGMALLRGGAAAVGFVAGGIKKGLSGSGGSSSQDGDDPGDREDGAYREDDAEPQDISSAAEGSYTPELEDGNTIDVDFDDLDEGDSEGDGGGEA